MNKAGVSLGYACEIKSEKICVFISHKKEDQHVAIELGNFLMNRLDVDIYLDVFDPELKEAVSIDNDSKIVASIKKGLKVSHILLCIISDKASRPAGVSSCASSAHTHSTSVGPSPSRALSMARRMAGIRRMASPPSA